MTLPQSQTQLQSTPRDLERAYKALLRKLAPYTRLWRYYDGEQPLVYASKRLREVFKNVDIRVVENWAAVVVDAVADRLDLVGLQVGEADDPVLEDLWAELELALVAKDVHLATLVIGEAFIIVGEDEDAEPNAHGITAYYNDPRMCHVFYDAENPRVKEFAAKWWVDADLKRRLTLYYPDRLEHYVSTGRATDVTGATSFHPDVETPTELNPSGVIPVFHFRSQRRTIKSDLEGILTVQDAVNKLLVDMLVAAEFGAFRQRWVISNADLAELKSSPYEHWFLPAGDGLGQQTQVGQFESSDLDNYLEAVEHLSTDIGRLTRTPKHYFLIQGGDPSGEALVAMEAPLVKKVRDRIAYFEPTWMEVAAYALTLAGRVTTRRDVTAVWGDPETVQPSVVAEIRESTVRAMVPLVTALRWEGKTEDEIDQMLQDKQQDNAANTRSLASALVEAERRSRQAPEVPGDAM